MSVVYKKLEDVCEILDSRRVPITAKDRKAGAYPYYGANGLQDYVADYIFDDEMVLLAEDGGNFGSKERPIAYRVSGKCWVNNHAHVLKAKSNMHVDYLCYALMFYDTEGLVNGATRQKLTQAAMRQMVIPYRDMTEQLQIIEKISQIVRSIEKRKEELQLLDQLVKSRFIELFGDPVRNSMGLKTMPLGKACCLKAGITTSADMIHEQSGEFSIPCYGGNGIRGYVESATQCGCYPIIGRQGALCGNVQLATGKFHATEHAVLVTPLIETNVVWLFYLLKMMDLYRFHTGAAQPGLAVKTLNTVDIPIADVAVQHQFAAFVEQTDKSKLAVQKGLQELEILKKSLMQQYFG